MECGMSRVEPVGSMILGSLMKRMSLVFPIRPSSRRRVEGGWKASRAVPGLTCRRRRCPPGFQKDDAW